MLRKRNALTIVEVIVVIVVLLLLAALLLPATRSASEAARTNSCLNGLKSISLALYNYHDKHGHFPPAYTVDDEGNRLHSWRTLILPYLEEQSLYDSIDLTKSWYDPVNAEARKTFLDCYTCPSTDLEEGTTTYLALVGPNWAFGGETQRSLDEFDDGTSKTILFVEVDTERAVHWMSPFDFNDADGLPFDKDTQGAHPGFNLAAFADGHIASIPRDVDPDVLRGMLTIAGDEEPANY
jgi:type II secretory pathway pseudopilin PulG